MKKLAYTVLFSILTASAFAQDHYITNKLSTNIYAEPNAQSTVIGSISAGERVNLASTNKKNGYSRITDQQNRTGWVLSNLVIQQESMVTRYSELEKELLETKELLTLAQQNSDSQNIELLMSLDKKKQEIAELAQSYDELSKQLASSQIEARNLRSKIDTQKESLLLQYFAYGGGVAGLGLLFGLLLPYIIPRKKKQPSSWA